MKTWVTLCSLALTHRECFLSGNAIRNGGK